jgi:hypothetical protein
MKRLMAVELALSIAVMSGVCLGSEGAEVPSPVKVIRVPNGGIQPQVAVDGRGIVHIVYFAGEALHGDLWYVSSADGGTTFSRPMRVNSQDGSAIATGNIRGARIAIEPKGRIHVAWNGSNIAAPKTFDGKAPMLYARLEDSGRGFEPQRNLIQTASGIDGGGAIAADGSDRVYVFWHAPLPGGKGEGDRRVWLAKSEDAGKTFAAERVAFIKPAGACGCCGMSAIADSAGSIYVLFRSASEMVHRDMYLISSHDQGRTFQGGDISGWNVGYCVMSTEAFAERGTQVVGAWESEKQIFFAPIHTADGSISAAIAAPGSGGNRKFPALAINSHGEILLAWTEGMGWKKGGNLSWQIFNKDGRPLGARGHTDGVPVWGIVSSYAAPDGTFRIVY